MRAVGSEGAALGEFNHPTGVTLTPDESRLLVCDTGNARVVVANACDGQSLHVLQGPMGTLQAPFQAIVVPQTGQVLVLDFDEGLILFAGVDDDTVVRTIGECMQQSHVAMDGPLQFRAPRCVAVLNGEVGDTSPDGPVAVVADTCNHRLALIRLGDGTLVRHLGSPECAEQAEDGSHEDTPPGRFTLPYAVSVVPVHAMGNQDAWLVVNDCHNWRIQVMTPTGTVVRIFEDSPEVDLGCYTFGLAVRVATGEVLVTCGVSVTGKVASFNLLPECSGSGTGRVVYSAPVDPEQNDDSDASNAIGIGKLSESLWGVAVTRDGAMWVVDQHACRLNLIR